MPYLPCSAVISQGMFNEDLTMLCVCTLRNSCSLCWRAVMCWTSWFPSSSTWMTPGQTRVSHCVLHLHLVGLPVCGSEWRRGCPMLTYPPFHLCVFVARVGLMHIGVFILLLLSGERNFGVRLNKPYTLRVPMDIPVFTGTHADLLIVVSRWDGSSQYEW